MSLAIIWHPSSLEHHAGPGHPESPARVEAILRQLRIWEPPTGAIEWHEAAPASEQAVVRVHPQAYLERLCRVAERGGGALDGDTFMNEHSFSAALHAAGAAVEAVRRSVAGQPAFAPVRPPGHHATADMAMGFCLINNVVVAARYALEELGLERVLIVDWDVHHGNGTQALVEREARIRYVSLHQWPLYPGTGRETERGVGNVFNVPRPPGLPRERYVADLDAAVGQAVRGWTPELVILSAGFDALRGDPLAGFTLEPDDYATWVARWRAWDVPIASVLEGGYVPERTASAVVAHLAALV